MNSAVGAQACIYIDIVDDRIFEKTETFEVHVDFDEKNIVIHNGSYIPVYIIDDDRKD